MTRKKLLLCIPFVLSIVEAAGLLTPKGDISVQQHRLLFDTIALMLIVVVPVIVMSLAFGYEFSKKNRRWPYTPDWSHNTLLECFWWGIPAIIILILSIITWKETHHLDPYKEIIPGGEKEVIQAVSLRWKWLFIYPKENIATINEVYFPAGKQVEFQITSDAPMSAFSIPQLGGQIYSMAGMRTKQFLYTDNKGVYEGLNTQLNGDGFSDMHFKAHVVNPQEFTAWVSDVKLSAKPLTLNIYKDLYKPTIAAPVEHYSMVPNDLFNKIMDQYTMPNSWLH
jgi:cytochrome o ubiquinol oxidase subunit 2